MKKNRLNIPQKERRQQKITEKNNKNSGEKKQPFLTTADYTSLIKISFKKLEDNPLLFAPNGLMLLFSLLFALGLLYTTGILHLIFTIPVILTKPMYLSTAIHALMAANPFKFWGSIVLYLALEFFMTLFFITAKYGMIKDVLLVGKTSLRQGMAFGKKHLLDVIDIYFFSFLLIFVPISALIAIGVFILPFSLIGGIVTLGLFILLGIIYAGFMIYRLVFVYPIMAFEREGPMKSIRDDFHYVKTHISHTFITWLVLIGMATVYGIMKSPLEVLRGVVHNGYMVIILTGVILLLEVLVSTWEHIFIFKAYLSGKHRNKY